MEGVEWRFGHGVSGFWGGLEISGGRETGAYTHVTLRTSFRAEMMLTAWRADDLRC